MARWELDYQETSTGNQTFLIEPVLIDGDDTGFLDKTIALVLEPEVKNIMVAAPEMLEALEAIVESAKGCEVGVNIQKARRAVEKARGLKPGTLN